MTRPTVGLMAALWGIVTPVAAPASSEPYLAIRTGLKCSRCHTNVTGGGKRSQFGSVYSQTVLPRRTLSLGEPGALLTPELASYLSLGTDVRVRSAQLFTGDAPRNEIEIGGADIYAEIRLVPERITIYADQVLAPGIPRIKEFFVLLGRLPGKSYLKVGQLFLPYGLRLQDDGEYVRQQTGFSMATSDLGVEVGFEPGPLSFAMAVTNGTQGSAENNSAKQISALASVVFPDLRAGASASRNTGPSGRRDVIGAFGGVRLWRLAVLGEADLIRDDPPSGRSGDQFAGYVEGSLLLSRGVTAKISYGYLDPDRDIGENARVRMRFGSEFFLNQFIQVSMFYTLLKDIPQATTDRDRLFVELHAFF